MSPEARPPSARRRPHPVDVEYRLRAAVLEPGRVDELAHYEELLARVPGHLPHPCHEFGLDPEGGDFPFVRFLLGGDRGADRHAVFPAADRGGVAEALGLEAGRAFEADVDELSFEQ